MNIKKIFIDDIGAFRNSKGFLLKARSVGPPLIIKTAPNILTLEDIKQAIPKLNKYDGMEINAYVVGTKINENDHDYVPIIFCHVDSNEIIHC